MKKFSLFLLIVFVSNMFSMFPCFEEKAYAYSNSGGAVGVYIEPQTPVPTPVLSNEKGYMIYDNFEGISYFDESGWKPLTVEEGYYSSATDVFENTTVPGIGKFIHSVRTSGGGTSGGMFREFPRMLQVLDTISGYDTPVPLPNDSVLIVEYDIKLGTDADHKRVSE